MSLKNITSVHDLASEDVIDLRGLLALRDELAGRRDDEEQTDPLDEDEAALLAEIERFDAEEVDGDVHNAWSAEPALVNDVYWDDFAREDADELILGGIDSDAAKRYFDYAAFAEDYRDDFEEVTLAGRTFLRRPS